MTTQKFLEFNGKKLTLVNNDGTFYIAIKPICEVLNVDYIQQFKNIKVDEILSQLLCVHTTVAADGKQREMACLPEKFIYGWLFSIRSDSPQLAKYKLECYDVLYNHFHLQIAERVSKLQNKTQLKATYQQIHNAKMLTDPEYKRLVDIQQELKTINNNLNHFDALLLSGQMEIGFE